jgi:N-acetylglucosaminyl-diphospho-decaprenol L-rhamnosyltransferase
MVSSPPLVSVLIINWNTRALLSACLDSVRATLREIDYELIVVDNASSDGSAEWLRTQPDVQLIANQENVGFARGNNQALARCRGKFALLLNSDAQLREDTVMRLLAVMQNETNAAAIAPMLLNADGSFQAGPNDDITLWNETLLMLGLARFLRNGRYPGYDANAPGGEYAWVGGTCLLMRRAAWEQIGLLDAEYFMYTEEADWCWRARQAAWTILYEPEAKAVHLGGGSSRHVPSQMRAALYKSKLIFFYKHRPSWQTFLLRNLLMLTASAKAVGYGFAARVSSVRAAGWNERALSFRMVVDAVKTVAAQRKMFLGV